MIAFIPAPASLERTTYPTIVGGDVAQDLGHIDVCRQRGEAIRGKGLARSRDASVSSTTITSAGVLVRRECQRVLIDASLDGTWRAHFGGEGKRGATAKCVGVLPDHQDFEANPELQGGNGAPERVTTVRAVDKHNTVIWPNAVAGRVYEVTAQGLWSSNPAIWGYWGPDGDFNQSGGIVGVGETFEGLLLMRMAVKDAAGLWTIVDRHGLVLCTQNGNLIGSATDYDALYGDNGGSVEVKVREL